LFRKNLFRLLLFGTADLPEKPFAREKEEAASSQIPLNREVNIQPVLSQIFHPDFHLGKWLDAQGVPAPCLV
jgi:hypothetical protein